MLDEAKWGLDFLVRMQGTDGSVLSIVGEPAASPPSAATGQSLYGPANTSATLATAAAFAAGARILKLPGNAALNTAAADLLTRARRPPGRGRSRTRTCSSRTTTARPDRRGSAAGQQETDDYGRLAYKLDAAAQLFAATGDATYKTFFDASYSQLHLISYSNYVVAVGRAGAGRGARLRGRRGRDGRDGDARFATRTRRAPRAAATWARSPATPIRTSRT